MGSILVNFIDSIHISCDCYICERHMLWFFIVLFYNTRGGGEGGMKESNTHIKIGVSLFGFD
jgi:hypothetical protein